MVAEGGVASRSSAVILPKNQWLASSFTSGLATLGLAQYLVRVRSVPGHKQYLVRMLGLDLLKYLVRVRRLHNY